VLYEFEAFKVTGSLSDEL